MEESSRSLVKLIYDLEMASRHTKVKQSTNGEGKWTKLEMWTDIFVHKGRYRIEANIQKRQFSRSLSPGNRESTMGTFLEEELKGVSGS